MAKLGSFSANISTFIKKTGVRADQVLRKLALDGLAGVIKKSPVDTGRFRGNWRVAINSTNTAVNENLFDPGAGKANVNSDGTAFSEGSKTIGTAKFGDSIVISNNVKYAPKLEQGWSKQAPNGVLYPTWVEIRDKFAAIVAAVK